MSLDRWPAYQVRTKSDAARAFDEMKAEIRAGTFRTSPVEAPKPAVTVETLAPIYLEHHVKLRGLKSRRNIVQHLNAFARAFRQPLSEITTLDVEQFALRIRQKGRAVATVNRYLAGCATSSTGPSAASTSTGPHSSAARTR